MATKRNYLFITAGALFLASSASLGHHVMTMHESDQKPPTSSASKTKKTSKKAAEKKQQPEPPVASPAPIADAPKAPATPPVAPTAKLPGQVFSLASWKLQLPVSTQRQGSVDEIKPAELNTYANGDFFYLNAQRNGVAFKAPANGATTKNSKYPRSELREMTADGHTEASWSNSSGVHTMNLRQAITHLPDVKSELVAAQIHDSKDDVIMVRLEGKRLFVESGGKNIGDLDTNYVLGTVYTVKIVAENSTIKVYYNDALKVTFDKKGSGYYFKAGCYTQTNTTKGDSAASYGEVTIYDLSVSHT